MTRPSLSRSLRVGLAERDDRGNMSMVMLVIIIGMGLGALMVPIVVAQNRSTFHTDSRVQALHEAESGINDMLGRLRAAGTNGVGDSTLLPCHEPGSPLTWRQQPGSSTTGYDVTVQYFSSDPGKLIASTAQAPKALSCVAASGPTAVPSFARITSTGIADPGNSASTRTLSTTYAFKTTNVFNSATANTTVTGGQILLNPRIVLATTQCIDAGLAPAAGTALSVQACSLPTTPVTLATKAQLFFYNSDLSLQLAFSITPALPYGLCISTTINVITLQNCNGVGSATSSQQWSLNADTAFVQASTVAVSPHVCLAVRAGGTDIVAKTCQIGYDAAGSWQPTPSVGSGAAGAANGQLVNLSQFASCAQAPVPAANMFILYPCDQTTAPSLVNWYQKFSYDPASGHWMTINASAQSLCLTSQGKAHNVTLASCGTSDSQKWTDYGVALVDQANASQWVYDRRYTTVDHDGLCLSLGPTSGTDADWFVPSGTTLAYAKITTDTCDGSERQKWNADPDPKSSTLKNTSEGHS